MSKDADLKECERIADELRHWIDESVPEMPRAYMLMALRNLEEAVMQLRKVAR